MLLKVRERGQEIYINTDMIATITPDGKYFKIGINGLFLLIEVDKDTLLNAMNRQYYLPRGDSNYFVEGEIF